MKRVVCLYRVSTLGQVDHDDIPMQKLACREYAQTHPDWEIVKEISEKGVSGYKISTNERDAIMEIKKMAMAGQFDVLLVFMFDRLGRRDDETPFVVQWFVSQGIEVWSTKEGEQRFDNHVDKLLNYIRFWLASGESEKTAIRVRTKHSQMVQDGQWRGGLVPYGYRLAQHGRTNKKSQPVPDLEIDPQEAAVIQQIFSLICNEGFGTNRVAQWLNDHDIKTKRNTTLWRGTAVRAILGNPVYIGILRFGDERSGPFENLRIIPDDVYERTLSIVKERAPKAKDNRSTPLRTNCNGLLTSLIFCADCGNRLAYGHSTIRRCNSTGTHIYHREYYRCYRKLSSPNSCQGQSTYTAHVIEQPVLDMVHGFFTNIRNSTRADLLEMANQRVCSVLQSAFEEAESEFDKAHKEMSALEDEAMKALMGTSQLDPSIINSMIPKCRARLDGAKSRMDAAREKMEQEKASLANQARQYKQYLSWADAFDQANTETKHMIISQLIERIEIGRNNHINIRFRLTARQYWGDNVANASA